MTEQERIIQHIVVNFDASGASISIMQSAVMLASRLQANLSALFIEDTDLLQLANLPFTREVTLHTALSRELSAHSVERNLMAMANRMQQSLEEVARLSDVSCNFRTVRGPKLESLIRESEGSELIIMLPRKRLSADKGRDMLADRHRPIMLFYDSSQQAQRALNVIKSINVDIAGRPLLVLTDSDAAEQEISRQLPQHLYRLRFLRLPDYDVSQIIALVRKQMPGLLILPLESVLLKQEAAARRLLDIITCMTIFVR